MCGWDPTFRPDAPLHEADVVNLGYVINVIEDTQERAATLRHAWALAQQVLLCLRKCWCRAAGRSQSSSETAY